MSFVRSPKSEQFPNINKKAVKGTKTSSLKELKQITEVSTPSVKKVLSKGKFVQRSKSLKQTKNNLWVGKPNSNPKARLNKTSQDSIFSFEKDLCNAHNVKY